MNSTIKVQKENCPQNHICPLIKMCPVGAITQKEFKAPEIDANKCISCGLCVSNCGYRAFIE